MTCENVTINGDGQCRYRGMAGLHQVPALPASCLSTIPWAGASSISRRRVASRITATLRSAPTSATRGQLQRRHPDDVEGQGAGAEGALPTSRWSADTEAAVDPCPARSQRKVGLTSALLEWPARLHLCSSTKGRRCVEQWGNAGDGQGGFQSQDRPSRRSTVMLTSPCSPACSATTTARRVPSR